MKQIPIVLLVMLFGLGSARASAQQRVGLDEPDRLSRAEAVALALASNPQVKESIEQVALLEGRILEARADALPDISWNTTGLRSRDPGLLNSPNFARFPLEFRSALVPIPANIFATTAGIRQTLFSFKLGKAIDAAREARRAGDEELRRARQATTLDVVRAYNQLVYSREQLRVVSENVSSKESHLEFARNRRAAGVATELEVLRAEVDVENQRAEQLRAENEVASARATLNTLMLRPTGSAIEPTDTLAVVPTSISFDDAVKQALAARPELATLRLTEQIRDKLIGIAAADAKPRIDLEGSYGFSVSQPTNLFRWNYSAWSTLVTVKMPVFDGWRTAARVAQAQAERNTVAQQIVALESQVRLDVQSAMDSLALASRTIQASELNVTQARRALEMTEANYRLGAATPLDVIDAQQALSQAENIRNQSLVSHANGRATLLYVMGQDPLQ